MISAGLCTIVTVSVDCAFFLNTLVVPAEFITRCAVSVDIAFRPDAYTILYLSSLVSSRDQGRQALSPRHANFSSVTIDIECANPLLLALVVPANFVEEAIAVRIDGTEPPENTKVILTGFTVTTVSVPRAANLGKTPAT